MYRIIVHEGFVGGVDFDDLAKGFWKKNVFRLAVGGHVEGGCYRNDAGA